ncbi:MAG: hypothetical protein WCO86_09910 [Planctomycetota bacterium]
MTIQVTPMDLAVAPICIDLGTSAYDHVSERRVYEAYKGEPLTLTMKGTQTYNAQGKPFDSDND